MKRLTHILLTLTWLSALVVMVLVSCSKYDTDSMGSQFTPVNSQVRAYTHLVYVEYTPSEARVWGPCKEEVDATVDGLHVRLNNHSDSLVVVAYGYAANHNPIPSGSLTIDSEHSYALYLSGLTLSCEEGPVINSTGVGACYMVLPEKSKNSLKSLHMNNARPDDATITSQGIIVLGGTGTLSICNSTPPKESAVCTHGIAAAGLQCQYGIKVDIESQPGDGIHLRHSMLSSLGTWQIRAWRHGIYAPDSLVLFGGTYTGSAFDGAYLFAPKGAALRMPKVTATSGWGSDIMDSLAVVEMFDSVQAVWQEQFEAITFKADTTYQLYDTAGVKVADVKTYYAIPDPFVLISDGKLFSDSELSLQKK